MFEPGSKCFEPCSIEAHSAPLLAFAECPKCLAGDFNFPRNWAGNKRTAEHKMRRFQLCLIYESTMSLQVQLELLEKKIFCFYLGTSFALHTSSGPRPPSGR